MPKARSKRSDIRDEKKRKRQEEQEQNYQKKRSRKEEEEDGYANGYAIDEAAPEYPDSRPEPEEKEFFGMLNEEEQEYFRRADEMLELNDFAGSEDRDLFIESVYREAVGKELKIASSQSCSRLMERLIQISTTAQKKSLFEAFGGHFLTLVQHRFASHCCEALFLKSAGAVTQELGGFQSFVVDTEGAGAEGEQKPQMPMEDLFLATLDELEGHLSYLITDRFASHTLRVLMLVLSGRPLEDASARSLMKSKKKEKISVAGSLEADQPNQGQRAVPASFTSALKKIAQDSVSNMDATSLRVLATHPIGNPTLQLLLELDLTVNKPDGKGEESEQPSLLLQLLPGAPKSLNDETSTASEFINGMIYDPIGSRLVETIITRAPGKVFKALNSNIFLPRIQGYVRNDVSSYAAIRVLNRIGKDDLVEAIEKIAPSVPQLVEKERYNVIRTLFERCLARGLSDEIKKLIKGLKEGCGPSPADLIMTLCCLKEEEADEKKKKDPTQPSRNQYAIQSHGSQLLTTLLSIPGPTKAVQEAILSLSPELLLRLANASTPTVTVLTTAMATPSTNPAFHKTIVNTITPHVVELATSQHGHNLLIAIAEIPSKGKERSVPFHMKEAIMARLGESERALRECWMGRNVWRNWKGDAWKTKYGDWKKWMREVDATVEVKTLPRMPQRNGERNENGAEQNVNGFEEEPHEVVQVEVEEMAVDKPEEKPEDRPEDNLEEMSEKKKPKKERKEKAKDKKDKKDKKEKKEKKEKKAKKGRHSDDET
jgi:nucleolar protein 9